LNGLNPQVHWEPPVLAIVRIAFDEPEPLPEPEPALFVDPDPPPQATASRPS